MINDIQKKPRSVKIGVFSIFLVIGFLTAIQSAFQMAPLIFLNISENQVGDPDLIVLPVSSENDTRTDTGDGLLGSIRLLNSTEIDDAMSKMTDISAGSSPRWLFTG